MLLQFIFTGVLAGILSGLFGIGGGIVIVPMLSLILKMPQHTATGTSLVALLLPVGSFAVWEYYAQGKITPEHIKWGFFISAGLFVGALLGAKLALHLPEQQIRRAFAVMLLAVAIKMWFKS